MDTNLIVMLTYNDKTLPNARNLFLECQNLDVTHWGFKDIGLPADQMKQLVELMKKAGKTTYLEVVSYSEEECLAGAKLALEYGFDYLMGTIFYDSVWEFIEREGLKYLPFVGNVHGSPSVLEGSVEEIIEEGKRLTSLGVHGFDLLAYRYIDDPEELAKAFSKAIEIPIVIAGSINSTERVDLMEEMGVWGFTIGTSLLKGDFCVGSFKDNLQYVIDYMVK